MSDKRQDTTWVVVPVKGFADSKTRLAATMSADQRAMLARTLFEHLHATVVEHGGFDGLMVATDSSVVAELALSKVRGSRPPKVEVLRDLEDQTLSDVVNRALKRLAAQGVDRAVVLMADLPHLEPFELDHILAMLEQFDVVAVPDQSGKRTNALGLHPPHRITTQFGHPSSFDRHCQAARDARASLGILKCRGLGFDLDTPEDLAQVALS